MVKISIWFLESFWIWLEFFHHVNNSSLLLLIHWVGLRTKSSVAAFSSKWLYYAFAGSLCYWSVMLDCSLLLFMYENLFWLLWGFNVGRRTKTWCQKACWQETKAICFLLWFRELVRLSLCLFMYLFNSMLPWYVVIVCAIIFGTDLEV